MPPSNIDNGTPVRAFGFARHCAEDGMKAIVAGLAFLVAVYAAWPYVYVYRLDRALAEDDRATLNRLVDLSAIRAELKRGLDREVADTLGQEPGKLLSWVKEQVTELGDRTVDQLVDLDWTRRALTRDGPFMSQVSYAFFESWDRFLVRIGELGEDPTHVRMSLVHGNWRVTAIYE